MLQTELLTATLNRRKVFEFEHHFTPHVCIRVAGYCLQDYRRNILIRCHNVENGLHFTYTQTNKV